MVTLLWPVHTSTESLPPVDCVELHPFWRWVNGRGKWVDSGTLEEEGWVENTAVFNELFSVFPEG